MIHFSFFFFKELRTSNKQLLTCYSTLWRSSLNFFFFSKKERIKILGALFFFSYKKTVISIYSDQIIKLTIIITFTRNLPSIIIIKFTKEIIEIMNRNFSLVFILLATLSIVNAIPFHKRDTTFVPCPGDPPKNPLTVSVVPDPLVPGQNATYSVSGVLDPPADTGSLLIIRFYDSAEQEIGEPFVMDLCATNTCPLSNIETTAEVPVPAELPEQYIIVVGVGVPDTKSISGCAAAAVGGAELPDSDLK
jgi:hypothetical protein